MNELDMSETVKPKSDQLNADDLIAGPITVTVQAIRSVKGDQPIVIDIDGGRMPFKPCKTMRRLLLMAWGKDGNTYVGRSMTLYKDETVKWAGKAIGGVRISHLSHIQDAQSFMLTATRGKRAQHTVYPLETEDHAAIINQYLGSPQGQQQALWETLNPQQQAAIIKAMEQNQ